MDASKITRKSFLAGLCLAGCAIKTSMEDEHAKRAHSLMRREFPRASRTEDVSAIIVGGGVAGLSAAWWLNRTGRKDFFLLELDEKPGGNSSWGENSVSPYPWGAHYLPFPGENAIYVRTLLEELGAIKGYRNGRPIYDEWMICRDPQERLYFRGQWQEGIVPEAGLTATERAEMTRFMSTMKGMQSARGNDGRRAFSIPVDLSSKDPAYRLLDDMSMADYLKKNHYQSEVVSWYANYCCRDDYGLTSEKTSAWAGIHYFGSRGGEAANAKSDSVLTWQAGNGWLIESLKKGVQERIRSNHLVFDITKSGSGHSVFAFDFQTNQTIEFRTRAVIYAAPAFTTGHVISQMPRRPAPAYSPWLVANITLDREPGGPGASLSWDNVSYYSKSLGYVVATHQASRGTPGPTVITYYLPLTAGDAGLMRKESATKSNSAWVDEIVSDLSRNHPGIEDTIVEVRTRLIGHGMPQPVPGFIWGQDRQKMLRPWENVFFAHSDMSGISIFEEAQYRGVEAARQAISIL